MTYIETVFALLNNVELCNACEFSYLQEADKVLNWRVNSVIDGELYFNHCKYNGTHNTLTFEDSNGIYHADDFGFVLSKNEKNLLNKYVSFVVCR